MLREHARQVEPAAMASTSSPDFDVDGSASDAGGSAFGASDDELSLSDDGADVREPSPAPPELGAFLSSWTGELDLRERASRRRRARAHTAAELRCGEALNLVIAHLGSSTPDGETVAILLALARTSSIVVDAAQQALFRRLRVSTRAALPMLEYALRVQPDLAQAVFALRIDMGAAVSGVSKGAIDDAGREATRAEVIKVMGSEFELRSGQGGAHTVVGLHASDRALLVGIVQRVRRLGLEAGVALAANRVLKSLGALPDLVELSISLACHHRQVARLGSGSHPMSALPFRWPGPSIDPLRVMRLEHLVIEDVGPFLCARGLETLTFTDCTFPARASPVTLPVQSHLRDLRFTACTNVPIADVVALLSLLRSQVLRFELDRPKYEMVNSRLAMVVEDDARAALIACRRLERLVWVE